MNAKVTEVRHCRDGIDLVVGRCPICGKQHTHGGGKPGGNWRSMLGHRAAHCIGGAPGGYVLIADADVKESKDDVTGSR